MNRHQFEDAISAYLENELSLSQRKEFNAYIEANPEAGNLVDSVKQTIKSLGTLPVVSTSPDFISRLQRRIELEKHRSLRKMAYNRPRSILGFTPLYAGIMSALIVAFVFVGMELMNDDINPVLTNPKLTNSAFPESLSPSQPGKIEPANTAVFTEIQEDSSDTLQDALQKRYKLNDRMRLVKDQR